MCVVCILTYMRVNIYIRKEDEQQWIGIIDKPQWIHERLRAGLDKPYVMERVDPEVRVKAILELSRQQNNPRFTGAIKSCKVHGIPLDDRGRCMQKGCKYS